MHRRAGARGCCKRDACHLPAALRSTQAHLGRRRQPRSAFRAAGEQVNPAFTYQKGGDCSSSSMHAMTVGTSSLRSTQASQPGPSAPWKLTFDLRERETLWSDANKVTPTDPPHWPSQPMQRASKQPWHAPQEVAAKTAQLHPHVHLNAACHGRVAGPSDCAGDCARDGRDC
jgi:hypothetical protein